MHTLFLIVIITVGGVSRKQVRKWTYFWIYRRSYIYTRCRRCPYLSLGSEVIRGRPLPLLLLPRTTPPPPPLRDGRRCRCKTLGVVNWKLRPTGPYRDTAVLMENQSMWWNRSKNFIYCTYTIIEHWAIYKWLW